jgi:hypothetical protein
MPSGWVKPQEEGPSQSHFNKHNQLLWKPSVWAFATGFPCSILGRPGDSSLSRYYGYSYSTDKDTSCQRGQPESQGASSVWLESHKPVPPLSLTSIRAKESTGLIWGRAASVLPRPAQPACCRAMVLRQKFNPKHCPPTGARSLATLYLFFLSWLHIKPSIWPNNDPAFLPEASRQRSRC